MFVGWVVSGVVTYSKVLERVVGLSVVSDKGSVRTSVRTSVQVLVLTPLRVGE